MPVDFSWTCAIKMYMNRLFCTPRELTIPLNGTALINPPTHIKVTFLEQVCWSYTMTKIWNHRSKGNPISAATFWHLSQSKNNVIKTDVIQ